MDNTYYLLTESEVIAGKSQSKVLMFWPRYRSIQYIKALVWDFPVMTEWTRFISYLFYGLFIMDLSLQPIKTNNWSADNFKKTHHLNKLYTWACDTVRWHWSADTLFDSCQWTITWIYIRMSTIKLNTDSICLGHLASIAWSLQENNAWSLQENSQSECMYYCSHIARIIYLWFYFLYILFPMQTLMLCFGSLWYQSLLKKIDNWYDFWLHMELVMAMKISILLDICAK